MRYHKKLKKLVDQIFLNLDIFVNDLSTSKRIILFILSFAFFYLASFLIFSDKFVGFDWIHFWGVHRVPPFYPPWTRYIVQILNWHSLVAITLSAILVSLSFKDEISTQRTFCIFKSSYVMDDILGTT